MYLTKMNINPARRGSRALLASPQAMHAAIMHGFTPDDHTAMNELSQRILWRIDAHPPSAISLFIASPSKPDLTHVVEQAGWPTRSSWQTRPYQPFLEQLEEGQAWGFRLTANPVHHARPRAGEDTKPVGHVTVEQQQRWFTERTGRFGLAIPENSHQQPELVVKDRRTLRFRRGNTHVTLATATYEGMLTITEPDAMRRALTQGIGRAKGYGCGLMTLAPLP